MYSTGCIHIRVHGRIKDKESLRFPAEIKYSYARARARTRTRAYARGDGMGDIVHGIYAGVGGIMAQTIDQLVPALWQSIDRG
jgi:hypothetical protein